MDPSGQYGASRRVTRSLSRTDPSTYFDSQEPHQATASSSKASTKKSKKVMDKASDEYRQRRARNNQSVKACREKFKEKSKQTEQRVEKLNTENVELRNRVDLLTKELNVLEGLVVQVGHPPPDD